MDNHADTHCFEANFWQLSFTSEDCTVSPFLPQYSEQMDVPICKGVTYLTLDSGEVVILDFGPGLQFGNRMEKSQINPNQCRNFWIQKCNDLTDPHRNLVIQASEELFIPMAMEGSTFGIVMHPPTYNEFHECQNIILSDEFDWDQSNNLLEISSMEQKYKSSSIFHQCINIVESRVPCAPPTIQCRYNLVIRYFGREMGNVSIGLAQDLMVDILIIRVRIKITKSGFTTYKISNTVG